MNDVVQQLSHTKNGNCCTLTDPERFMPRVENQKTGNLSVEGFPIMLRHREKGESDDGNECFVQQVQSNHLMLELPSTCATRILDLLRNYPMSARAKIHPNAQQANRKKNKKNLKLFACQTMRVRLFPRVIHEAKTLYVRCDKINMITRC